MIGHPTCEVRMLPILPTKVEWSPMLDEPPCDLCPLAGECRAHRQACEQFKSFVMYGGAHPVARAVGGNLSQGFQGSRREAARRMNKFEALSKTHAHTRL